MLVTIYVKSNEHVAILTVGAIDLERQGLIERICRGDEGAANEFYDQYQSWQVRIASSRVGEGDAEDVVQDVFAKLLKCEKLSKLSGNRNETSRKISNMSGKMARHR